LARVQPLPLWCFEKEFEKATTKPKSGLATVILLAWTKVTKVTKVKKVTKVTKVKKGKKGDKGKKGKKGDTCAHLLLSIFFIQRAGRKSQENRKPKSCTWRIENALSERTPFRAAWSIALHRLSHRDVLGTDLVLPNKVRCGVFDS